jgi:GT2 family glycosyltransferase
MGMHLSIIVVNWNTCDLLERCLQAVFETVNGVDFEVWVVDNASTDGSTSMVLRRFPQVRLIINEENAGFSRANNQAIRLSNGRYVLLLNSDAFLTAHAAEQMTAFLSQNEQAGIVGANLFYPDGKSQDSYGPLPSLTNEIANLWGLDKRREAVKNVPGLTEPVETGMVSGACLMLRRSMLDQVGLLDEGFFFFSEEIDLCSRAQKSGWKVYHLPSAKAVHVRGGSSCETSGRVLLLYRGKLQYFSKHSGAVGRHLLYDQIWLATLAKVVVYTILRWLNPHHPRKDNHWMAVLKGLPKLRS